MRGSNSLQRGARPLQLGGGVFVRTFCCLKCAGCRSMNMLRIVTDIGEGSDSRQTRLVQASLSLSISCLVGSGPIHRQQSLMVI